MEAVEVVQLFVAPTATLLQALPANSLPKKALKGFARVTVKPGSHAVVELSLSSKDFRHAVALGAHPTPYCLVMLEAAYSVAAKFDMFSMLRFAMLLI